MLTSLKMDVSQSWRNGNLLCPNSVKTKVPYENVNSVSLLYYTFIYKLLLHIYYKITVIKTKKITYHFKYVGL